MRYGAAVPGGPPIRVLLVGWLNAPHVVAWAELVAGLGHEVHLAGRVVSTWPRATVPDAVASVHELPAAGPPVYRGLALSRHLRRTAERVDPDLVHAHWLPEAGWMAAREGLRPLISSAWGSDVLGAGRVARRRSRRAVLASELVLADSEPLARAVRELAGRPVEVEVVRRGIDLTRFAPGEHSAARAELGWPQAPTVLSPRALGPLYNPDVVLAAFALARMRVPPARLVLKHPGTSTPDSVRERIAALGLDDAVTIVANVDSDRLPTVYRAAEVVVSIPSSDSSPVTAWEALACGAPLVVSELAWARDELEDGRDALLVPVDAAAVADALVAVLTEPELSRGLSAGARARAQRTVDPDENARRVDALYRRVAGGGG